MMRTDDTFIFVSFVSSAPNGARKKDESQNNFIYSNIFVFVYDVIRRIDENSKCEVFFFSFYEIFVLLYLSHKVHKMQFNFHDNTDL